jgi:hypothetical protein
VEEQLPIQDYGSLATEGQTTQHAQNDFCVFSIFMFCLCTIDVDDTTQLLPKWKWSRLEWSPQNLDI